MKYKVGDRVKVRSDLKENMTLNEGWYGVTKDMVKFKDKWVTISKALETSVVMN